MARAHMSGDSLLKISLYAAFTEVAGGGSEAGLVLCPPDQGLSTEAMQEIAAGVGAPATCFVESIEDNTVEVRFFSTTTEYGMCGHGTIALFTWLIDTGQLKVPRGTDGYCLKTPSARSDIKIISHGDSFTVSLALEPARSGLSPLGAESVTSALGLDITDLHPALPIAVSRSDFTHLLVPLRIRSALDRIEPDLAALSSFADQAGIETVAPFTSESTPPDSLAVFCRDFCPAVGTDEAAATGTTNRAITSFLVEHGRLAAADGHARVRSTQGEQMGRPSVIESHVEFVGETMSRVWIGGTAVPV